MVTFCQRIDCTAHAQEGSRYCERHSSRRVTVKQQRVLDFVKSFTAANQYPPTVREIGDALGIASTNTVAQYLYRLELSGLIYREPGTARGLRILEPKDVRNPEQLLSTAGG